MTTWLAGHSANWPNTTPGNTTGNASGNNNISANQVTLDTDNTANLYNGFGKKQPMSYPPLNNDDNTSSDSQFEVI